MSVPVTAEKMKRKVIKQTILSPSPVISFVIFCNRKSGGRQRRFTMILNSALRQFSTIFYCSLLLDLQKNPLLIAQEIMLFSKC